MAIQKISNALIYCLSSDTKPTVYGTNTLLYEQDTGNVYRYSSGVWSLIQGASKTETLTNKTIDAKTNYYPSALQSSFAYNNIRHGIMYHDIGGFLSTVGCLAGQTVTGTVASGTSSTVNEDFWGITSAASSGAKAGAQWKLQTRADKNPRIRFRFFVDSTATGRLYAGWSSNATIPATDTPLATTEHGVLFGYRSTDTNYKIFHNDGTGAMVADDLSTPTAKTGATSLITIDIKINSAVPNAVITLNNSVTTTITTRLPGSTTNLALALMLITSSTVARKITLFSSFGENT